MSSIGRWWSDPERSLWALGQVNPTNVRMGVGTSVLGYHGLASGQLMPLSQGTLADGKLIMNAFDQIDLDPVTHAVSKSISSIMGDSSDNYARLWVEDLHEKAMETALNLYGSLTSHGMPSPLALDRVTAIAGVPSNALGRVFTHLREQRTSPRVLEDVSDRVLMEYASRRGQFEDTAVVEIGKNFAFDEGDHPRASNGRFKTKGGAVEADPRAQRQQRRLRRMKRLTTQQNKISQLVEQQSLADRTKKTGSSLKQVLSPLRPAKAKEVQQDSKNRMVPGSPLGRALQRRDQYRQYEKALATGVGLSEVATPSEYDLASSEDLLKAQFAPSEQQHSMDSQEGIYFPVSRKDVQILLDRAAEGFSDFSVGGFERIIESHLQGETQGQALAHLTQAVYTEGIDLDDVVFLRVRGNVPLNSSDDNLPDLENGRIDYVNMPSSARLELGSDWEFFSDKDGLQYDDELVIERPIDYVFVNNKKFDTFIPVIDVTMVTDFEQFPLTRTEKVRKAQSFREADVVRDVNGRFAPEGKKLDPEQSEREARRGRRFKRQQRLSGQIQAANAAQNKINQEKAPRQALAPLRQQAASAQVIPAKHVNRMNPAMAAKYREVAQRVAQMQSTDKEGVYAGMQALRFTSDQMDAFHAVTGINPFGETTTGDMTSFLGSGRMDVARQDILSELMDRQSQGNVMTIIEAIGSSISNPIVNQESKSKTMPAGRENLYEDEFSALIQAETAADQKNQELDYGQQYLPFVEVNEDSLYGFTYKPMMTLVTNEPMGAIIIGDDEAMAAMNAGLDVDFEPIVGVALREMVMGSGLNETINPTEFPDAPIQAVRVKIRENP